MLDSIFQAIKIYMT